MQQDFKSKIGIYVDFVKQSYGTSNDGNTARRFFQNADRASEITGVNKEFIHRLYVILQVSL